MNIPDNFQAKAHSATSVASSLSPGEALGKSLTCDRPTISSAVKSYMSLCAARSMSASDPNAAAAAAATNSSSSSSFSAAASLQNAVTNSLAAGSHPNDGDIDIVNNKDDKIKCYFTKSKNPQQAALLCARALLKSINSFVVPQEMTTTTCTTSEAKGEEKEIIMGEEQKLEYEVVRILWNGLIKNGKKPSMVLGRSSLSHVFPLMKESVFQVDGNGGNNDVYPISVDLEEAKAFVNEFGNLLDQAERRKNTSLSSESKNDDDDKNGGDNNVDDDSCLLWDVDGGKAELERRRKRRLLKKATAENEREESSSSSQHDGLTIEEIE